MESLVFRQATEADIPFLMELRRITMTEHQLASGVQPSEEERIRRVRASFHCAQIIESGGKPIGLLKVVRNEFEWDLVQIQLAPEFQRRGIGSGILQSLIEEARAAAMPLRLSVLKASPAKRLYERVGFVVTQEKANAYEMSLGTSAFQRQSNSDPPREDFPSPKLAAARQSFD